MTASDIIQITVTVAIAQLVCDLIAYWRIFSGERYERAVAAYGRAKWKKDKATKEASELGIDVASLNSTGDNNAASDKATSGKQKSKIARATKAYERADQDCSDAAAGVTRHHMLPNMLTSILFVILMRVLGTEHKGKIMAVLPFTPWNFFKRITSRGLEFDPSLAYEPESEDSLVKETGQAASFMLIYMLTGLSVKHYVHKLFGTTPPSGTDGVMGMMQSTWAKKMLRSAGIDPDELKMD